MKRLMVLVMLVVLLAGGGVGAWFFLRAGPGAESQAEVAEHGLFAGARFVELDPMVFPIIREGRVILHVTLSLAIELKEPLPVETVLQLKPRLRDSLFTELHAIYGLRFVQERGFDLPQIRSRLVERANAVFGPGTVKAVLIQSMAQNRPGAA